MLITRNRMSDQFDFSLVSNIKKLTTHARIQTTHSHARTHTHKYKYMGTQCCLASARLHILKRQSRSAVLSESNGISDMWGKTNPDIWRKGLLSEWTTLNG